MFASILRRFSRFRLCSDISSCSARLDSALCQWAHETHEFPFPIFLPCIPPDGPKEGRESGARSPLIREQLLFSRFYCFVWAEPRAARATHSASASRMFSTFKTENDKLSHACLSVALLLSVTAPSAHRQHSLLVLLRYSLADLASMRAFSAEERYASSSFPLKHRMAPLPKA